MLDQMNGYIDLFVRHIITVSNFREALDHLKVAKNT